MGLSWSSRRRQNQSHRRRHPHHPRLHSSFPQAALPPPSSDRVVTLPQPLPVPASYAFAANSPYPAPQQTPYLMLPAPAPAPSPPPPPPSVPFAHHPNAYNHINYAGLMMGQSSYYHQQYYPNQSSGWVGVRSPTIPPQPPVPYVDHQSAKKIKNDVNVHKDTIRVQVDEKNPDSHLVSFTFDAIVDGSITIFYFAKEGDDCTFTQLYPEIYTPVRIPFSKGLGRKFYQPSGSGIDLGFFDMDDLSNPSPGEDVFPLVIFAESGSSPNNELPDGKPANISFHAQITEAVLEKDNEGNFKAKVIKQILWVDGVQYELREIYGISNSDEKAINENDSGKECVICMTDPKDTVVLPCRHMCMCSECAKTLRLQSKNCPICRQPIEELIEIKVEEGQPMSVQNIQPQLQVAAA